MRAATLKSGDPSGKKHIDSRGGTLILSGQDIVSIQVKRFPMQYNPKPAGLVTDSDIGGRAGGGVRGGGNRGVGRELQKVKKSCALFANFLLCFSLGTPSGSDRVYVGTIFVVCSSNRMQKKNTREICRRQESGPSKCPPVVVSWDISLLIVKYFASG